MFIFDDPHFKKAFWEWFDSIPKEERERFQLYKADMAELFFFNKIYKNKKKDFIISSEEGNV